MRTINNKHLCSKRRSRKKEIETKFLNIIAKRIIKVKSVIRKQ